MTRSPLISLPFSLLSSLSALMAVSLAPACGAPEEDEDEPPAFSDEPLAGVVGGAAWTFAGGDSDSFLSDADSVFAVFSGAAFAACVDNVDGPQLLTSLPRAPGVVELGFSSQQTVTFSPESGENLAATDGAIRIDEVSDTAISGAIVAEYDDDNAVDGVFTITVCVD